MTDSTIDRGSGDGTSELGPSMDELFGGIESLPGSEPVDRNEPAETDDEAETVEDVTATDIFEQLQTEVEVTPADSEALLEDETPDEIIESADEPAEPEQTVDDDILADEDELDSLLLTGRTEGDEFLWVETPDTESSDPAAASSDPAGTPEETASDAEPESDDAEQDRTEEAASPSIPEEEIETFTKEGPDATSASASAADGSAESSATSNASGNDSSGSTKTRSDRRGKARKRSRRNRSKSEKAGGLYAKLRSKLSEMV